MSPDSDPRLLEMCKPLIDADLKLIEAIWADDKAAMRHRLTQMCELYDPLLAHVQGSSENPQITITGYDNSGWGLQVRAEAQLLMPPTTIDYRWKETDPHVQFDRWLLSLFEALERQQPQPFGAICGDIGRHITRDSAVQHIVQGVNSNFVGVETVFTLVPLSPAQ